MKHLLDGRARRVYLAAWYRDARRQVRRRRLAPLRRELVGGVLYASLRVHGAILRRIGRGRAFAGAKAAPTR